MYLFYWVYYLSFAVKKALSTGNGSDARGRRSGSNGDMGVVDSNVLRKVASLTLDRATIDKRVTKPKFVPEKLDFKIYEKFEGKQTAWIFNITGVQYSIYQITWLLRLQYSDSKQKIEVT